MKTRLILLFVFATAGKLLYAQDSITVRAHPRYDSVSRAHRHFFGENYRKEYAALTTVPVIHLSTIKGGLTVVKQGGGHQSRSLRLVDKNGKEWVLRSVDKYPEVLLPEVLRQTFAKDLLTDNMSSQHPFAALVVPPLAAAAGVPHSNPMIGYVAADPVLGEYAPTFEGTLCLLEEREPDGNSDDTDKMYAKLQADNTIGFDSSLFLRARLLDLFIGDWDRHEDQWRWVAKKTPDGKKYIAVPRDRDQVFYINSGVVPGIADAKWLLPFLQGYGPQIKNPAGFMWESRNMNGQFLCQFTEADFMRITHEFQAAMTDSLIEAALRRLPASAYNLRHDQFARDMKARRENLTAAMQSYYRFLNRIVDIRLSDKNEMVAVTDAGSKGMQVTIYRLNAKDQQKEQLFSRAFDPAVTQEVRLFLSGGDDSVYFNRSTNAIKLRVVGGPGEKKYNVAALDGRTSLYDTRQDAFFYGKPNELHKHLHGDTSFRHTDLYNFTMPLALAGINADDGFLLGLGFRHIQKDGFRKTPYSGLQQLLVSHSFSTRAYSVNYRGEWMQAIGKADIVLQAVIKAPNNTINFFGQGNETDFVKFSGYRTFYRARFNTYAFAPALRWRLGKGTSISAGPAVQYYHMNTDENKYRSVYVPGLIHSYDSSTVGADRWHVGGIVAFERDKRNSVLLAKSGTLLHIAAAGYGGANDASKAYGQATADFSFYVPLGTQSLVLANRTGGGVTVGNAAFYQSLFLGGQGNLLGYRQYRFAGQHNIYNNLELRWKLANVGSYILPGEFGLTGFYDVGRVWEKEDHSDKWHNGLGGGVYFSPLQMAMVKLVAGHSDEGWYPYFTLGMRF
ncbi:BamA/TamA family outer membrane protein [Deminuibacter soli]|uniref:Bacterial surface antigen (D15) domain-containing protein n=1 Tax=Deminuibacter soli TaxID=2291815 RepID=A0A3E1NEG2_9BACT|nr:BamA/TamA family outer membrane protein [Deminuibacter soli]RFM26375.1 hypothetical protein DXN05_20935 [Deminuibacter soli]